MLTNDRVIDRRAFVTVVAGSVLAAPLISRAKQAGKVWRIGLISVAHRKPEDVFFRRLGALGYVEGQNLVVERRYSAGRAERFPEFAAALARLNVDIIIVTTTPAALAVKNATRTIPIVQPTSIDPVGAGLAAGLSRPGGNFTGATVQAPELAAKRLQLLVQAVPHVSRVAVVWNAANPANAGPWREVQDAARVLGINVQSREVRGPSDFERILAEMAREGDDALLLIDDQLTLQHGEQIVDFTTQKRIPSMFDRPELATAGGLMSYGADEGELWQRAADLADKILKGAKPADLPIEQPTKFKFVINLKTAKALSLTIPPSLLLRADEVIQ
jgi:putative ABC transport system substrate-binding protein